MGLPCSVFSVLKGHIAVDLEAVDSSPLDSVFRLLDHGSVRGPGCGIDTLDSARQRNISPQRYAR